jgi:2-keto-3-deoxy-L-rhamnonate aldolase RhmA
VSGGFADRLARSGTTLIGAWVKLPTTAGVELLALAGFDFVIVDMEHAPLGIETVYELIGAALGRDLVPLVRVPDAGASVISRVLDSGAAGVLVPHVDDVGTAEQVIGAARFPPQGTRGFGPTVRAGAWGGDVAGYRRSADQAFVVPQLESRQAIEAAASIGALDGLGGLFVGPADLTVATGLGSATAEFRSLLSAATSAAKRNGVPIGTAVDADPAAVRELALIYDFVVIASDASLLRGAAAAVVDAAHTN